MAAAGITINRYVLTCWCGITIDGEDGVGSAGLHVQLVAADLQAKHTR